MEWLDYNNCWGVDCNHEIVIDVHAIIDELGKVATTNNNQNDKPYIYANEKKEDELKSELLDDKYPYPTPIRVRVGAEDNRNGKRR